MKVAVLLSNRWNSAITEYALSAAHALRRGGHEICFVPLSGSPAERRAKESGLPVIALPSFGITCVTRLNAIIQGCRPDIVLTCGGPEETLASLVPGSFKIMRFRGQAMDPPRSIHRLRARLQSWRTNGFIFPAEKMAQAGRAYFDNARCYSVPLGIDEAKFHPASAATVRDELVIFGRFDPVKGHARFMEIYAVARDTLKRQDRPMPVLHIVGEPANVTVENLRVAAQRAGLAEGREVMITTGRHPDPARLMTEALIGVVPSLGSEIICRVAEEFLLCGAPVFVSGAGSLDEVIIERSGWSYRGADIAAAGRMLAGAIETSRAESPRARQERAALALSVFSLAAMSANLENVLRKLDR